MPSLADFAKHEHLSEGQILNIVGVDFHAGTGGNFAVITSKDGDGTDHDYITKDLPVMKRLRIVEQTSLSRDGKQFDWSTGLECQVVTRYDEQLQPYLDLEPVKSTSAPTKSKEKK